MFAKVFLSLTIPHPLLVNAKDKLLLLSKNNFKMFASDSYNRSYTYRYTIKVNVSINSARNRSFGKEQKKAL